MNQDTARLLLSQNKKTYNSIAQNFSQTRNSIWPELDFFIKNYIKDGYDILDIGCGNGRLFGALRANGSLASSMEAKLPFGYIGIDISEKLIDEAERKFSPKFLVNDILNLPPDFIQENKFDAVFAIAVLNHIPSRELRELAIENIFKLLKPTGYLLMTNWNLWNLSSAKSWWKLKYPAFSSENIFNHKLDFKDIITYWGEKKLPLYYHAFTKREIKKLLKASGFKIIKNYYSLDNEEVGWRKAKNLLTVAQK